MRDSSSIHPITRRQLLSLVSEAMTALALAPVLAACAPKASPTTAAEVKPTTPPTTAAKTEPTTKSAVPVAEVAKPKDVPRNRTLKLMFSYTPQFPEWQIWNGYSVGANFFQGIMVMYEPLFYFSAYANEWIPWLAEGYKYNDAGDELTLTIRSGVTWSDGVPFSAEDVAYTIEALRTQETGKRTTYADEVSTYVAEAKATSPTEVVVKMKSAAPRFVHLLAFMFGRGLLIVPKHIFSGQDWTTFTFVDLEKGWPVTTSPWRLVYTSPEQKIIDRADDWWAVKAGLVKEMPKVERIVFLPVAGETQMSQAVITNEIEATMDLRPRSIKAVLDANPKITSWTGNEPPYGYVDWAPQCLYLNCEKPPFDDPDVRWAISYFIDRQELIDVAYGGAGTPSRFNLPAFPNLKPYFELFDEVSKKLGLDTLEYNPTKGAELLEKKGFKKGSDGFWVDSSGQRLKLPILGGTLYADIGAVYAAQFERQGIESTYEQPPDTATRFAAGDYVGNVSLMSSAIMDPYPTLKKFHSKDAVNRMRWENARYDEIMDEMAMTSPDDTEKMHQLFKDALEVWLPELPLIQSLEWYHRMPMNTTYWTGWPTRENPYVNCAFWHWTWPLMLQRLEPVE